jgi:hypothetical protein
LEDTQQIEEPSEEICVDRTDSNEEVIRNSQPMHSKAWSEGRRVEMSLPPTVKIKTR